MAIKFQFNKTFLQQLNKQLKVRTSALPTLKAKEAALRLEVKKAHDAVNQIKDIVKQRQTHLESSYRIWIEFDLKLTIKSVDFDIKQIAGVKTPTLKDVYFHEPDFSLVLSPAWFTRGLSILKSYTTLLIKLETALRKVQILEYARKKTTQKVNLYEKVQIPEYQEAIRKIKRFLEDEENLAKSSQKILKMRLQAQESAA